MKSTTRSQPNLPRQSSRRLYDLDTIELDDYWVSEHNQFKDRSWYFTNSTPGTTPKNSTINWDMVLQDGSRLTEKVHAKRLRWAKVLLLTLLEMPDSGKRPSPGTIPGIQRELNCLLSWMARNAYDNPNEMTPEVVRQYIDDLPSFLASGIVEDVNDDGEDKSQVDEGEVEQEEEQELGVSVFDRALHPLVRLWEQRNALKKFGIESLRAHPFDGRGTRKLASELAKKAIGWVKPLPDEVAIPLFNKAVWFVGGPAQDVIRLLDAVRDPLSGTIIRVDDGRGGTRSQKAGTENQSKLKREDAFLEAFKFSVLPGEQTPWHEPFVPNATISRENMLDCRMRVRELWEAVRDSAIFVVQGLSGMRISEIAGIEAGIDQMSGLPICVRIEESVTGLYECFIIRTVLSKTAEGLPREVDWVLGMRPKGSKEIPVAVQALIVLNQLHEPWRANARTKRLILSSVPGRALPKKTTNLGAMASDKIRNSMKKFISRWIDLTNLPNESARKSEDNDLVAWRESRGSIFSTHMLRKSWANYTLACDSRLLPAIQMQFHHLSLAMTEGGYIGRNPLLLESLDSVAVQKRNLLLFELVTGKSALAGRMGEQLELATAALRQQVASLPTSKRWKSVCEWADKNQLRLYFSEHATCCPTKTSEMRCQDAANTPIWLRTRPNSATREPSLCAGCACAIMDKSHEAFWADRYVSTAISIKVAEASGADISNFQEIRFRSEQAKSVLKKFGSNIDELNLRISSS